MTTTAIARSDRISTSIRFIMSFIILFAISVMTASLTIAARLELCNAIDCRAGDISAGLLTGVWKQECRKSEAVAIASCLNSGGQIKKVCQPVCPASAWPTSSNRDKPPVDKNVQQAIDIMRAVPADASPQVREKAERKALKILGRYAGYMRGMPILHGALERRRQMRKQHRQIARLAKSLSNWSRPRGPGSFNGAPRPQRSQMASAMAALLIQSMAQSERDTGMGRSVLPTLIKLVDDLAGFGADVAKFMQKFKFEAGFTYINRGAQMLRALDSASKLKAGDEASARKFASDFTRLLPNNAAPGYLGPVSSLAQDNVVWTRAMTEASTDGVAIVTNAMKRGKVDATAVEKLNERLAKLKKGPWTKDGFKRVIKEAVEDAPAIGYIADLFTK